MAITKKLLNDEQEEIVRRGLVCVNEMEKLLAATKKCLAESEIFPLYLADLQERSRVLGLLAAKHVVLSELKHHRVWAERSRVRRRQAG